MNPFRGTLTALVTPFRDGQLDLDALDAHVQRQIDAGVDGLVPCGTTGESPTLSVEEYAQVIQHVVRTTAGRVPVLAGAGTNSTSRTLTLAQTATECGATGLLLVAPYYNKPPQEGLYQHFSTVARSTPLPIVLYNIPGRCGVEIAIDTLRRLFDDHENIVVVKHATGNVASAADLRATCGIDVLSGDDPLTLPLMSVGAVGVISVLSNIFPTAVKRLTTAALAGDYAAALAAHRATYRLAWALLSLETNPIPIKTAMALRGWCRNEFRLPLCPLSAAQRERLEALLAESDLS
ncbi:MAG: 4-hydroxy-tetrahydrodipicolinate synthase [Phycisphaerae bacterium]|jgi:4-hydroxy-tetrahydrodipicolinate synthase